MVPGHSQAQHTGCNGVARPRGLPLVQSAGGFSEGGRGRRQPGGWRSGLSEVRADPSLSPTTSSHGVRGKPSGLGVWVWAQLRHLLAGDPGQTALVPVTQ